MLEMAVHKPAFSSEIRLDAEVSVLWNSVGNSKLEREFVVAGCFHQLSKNDVSSNNSAEG